MGTDYSGCCGIGYDRQKMRHRPSTLIDSTSNFYGIQSTPDGKTNLNAEETTMMHY